MLKPLIGSGSMRTSKGVADTASPSEWSNGSILFDRRHWACAGAELEWQADKHLSILTEHGGGSYTRVQFDGRNVFEGAERAGALTFVPAGTPRKAVYVDASLVYSALWFAFGVCDGPAELSTDRVPRGFANGNDDVVTSLIKSIGIDLATAPVRDCAYMEQMVRLILLRLAGNQTLQGRSSQGSRLSTRQLNCALDFIEGNLDRSISLRDLASAIGMPVEVFSRRFKETTGRTPYAYVLERRVSRAEGLIRRGDMQLSEIAVVAGFSSQSHLTSMFRRFRGVTPATFRDEFASGS